MLSLELIISIFIIAATFSAILNALLRNLSKSWSFLIDLPDDVRKFHAQPTPLVGGFGIYFALCITFFVINSLTDIQFQEISYPRGLYQFLLSSFGCLLIFMLDDIFTISPKMRLILQSLIVLALILSTGTYIAVLPDLLSFGSINLGYFGIPFTIFCCVGLMNAFNMIDGLNGLCAAVAINALFLQFIDNPSTILPIILMGSVTGFMLYNIGFFGERRTIFLGDSGSNFIGLAIAVHCIVLSDDINSSNTLGTTSAVTMLWLVAIPLWDCIRVILSRIADKRLPFNPGRDHFHHILLDQGLSSKEILRAYTLLSFVLGFIGIMLEKIYHDTPYVSFYCFIFSSFIYLFLCTKLKSNNENS
jgi:UDP-GlcNAc:undecaprenyl-phosphate GlcNAc-1-phosphate transferase